MIQDFLIPLAAVALAELGDKTQLSVLLLSSKTKRHLELLVGVMLAFLIVDGIAIVAGSVIISLVPVSIIKIISGVVFIVFGILLLVNLDKDGKKKGNAVLKTPFISGFSMIMMAEWGDKTQIASGLFATNYNPVMVLLGTMTALFMLSLMAIYLASSLQKRSTKKP